MFERLSDDGLLVDVDATAESASSSRRDARSELRAALAAAPVAAEIVRYPHAGHGFHCDMRESYLTTPAS
jgi:hypothetical protein